MSTTRKEEFFEELSNSTKWNSGVAFNRTNALPLDSHSVFSSVAELAEYAASGSVKYPGQVVVVVVDDSNSVPYIINGDGTYTQLNAAEILWEGASSS